MQQESAGDAQTSCELTSGDPTSGENQVAKNQVATKSQATAKNQAKEFSQALRSILAPVTWYVRTGRILGALSGVVAIAPYVMLVELGRVLLEAARNSTPPDAAKVSTLTTWLVMSLLVQLGLYFVALLVTHMGDLKLNHVLRQRLVERISTAPLSWFSQATSGRIRKAIQDDTTTLHHLVAHAPVDTTMAIVMPSALSVYAFVVDWRLGLISIATLPIFFIIQAIMMRDMPAKTALMDGYLGEVSATAVEFADGITVVKAFGRTGHAHERFTTAAQNFAQFYAEWAKPLMRASALSLACVSVPLLVFINIGLGSLVVASGAAEPFDLITTTLIALVIPGAINVITSTMWAQQNAGGAANRIMQTLDIPTLEAPQEPAPCASATTATPPHTPTIESVEFDNVHFSYGDTVALQGVSLQLQPGTVTALVGPSGSGKSTLATMLARFQDPDSGQVRINGRDIRTMPTGELYRHVAFVLQDPQLLKISIRDNIRLAHPHATDEQVLAAARAARIDDVITALPNGLDTIYGTGGSLSGGQAQRISIARAILAGAPILVLDEALAAMDADSEADIQAALSHLARGRTSLVIAHRPESVYRSHQVVRLENAHVVERLVGAQVTPESVQRIMRVEASHA